MFNLNIPAASLLGIDNNGVCTTPKTPEIVNTLIAMTTNPMDNYSFNTSTNAVATTPTTSATTAAINNNNSNNQQLISQDSCQSSCSGSPLDSPAGTNSTPNSVQQTCSQFIKAGLKITIQNKRKMSSCDSSSGTEQGGSSRGNRSGGSNCTTTTKTKYARKSLTGDTSEEETTSDYQRKSPKTGLTPEDEDRRKRRRERNKIAATKCRMKKRERTQNLISESEQLETQNVDMKSQVRNLEMERRQLYDMLQSHSSTCIRPGGYQTPLSLMQSPAYKYLKELGFCDSTTPQQQPQQQQDLQMQKDQQALSSSLPEQQPQPIIPMNTVNFPGNNGAMQQQQEPSTMTSAHLLANGYCKPSPPSHELGYLSSPSHHQDLTACLTSVSPSQPPQHHHHHLQNNGNGASHTHITATLLKSDYIPNCENSNGATNCGATGSSAIVVDTCNTASATADFVLKHELVDTQSPYTTAQSAERFLFETNCENFDIKHSSNNLSNNNNNNCNNNNNNNNINNNNLSSHNNINTIVDFHTQLIATPTSCQPSYDSLLIKNDFLTSDTELLAQLADADAEFTDLDSGVTAYSHLTNGGCLA